MLVEAFLLVCNDYSSSFDRYVYSPYFVASMLVLLLCFLEHKYLLFFHRLMLDYVLFQNLFLPYYLFVRRELWEQNMLHEGEIRSLF